MDVKRVLLILLMSCLVSSCAPLNEPEVMRVALLAPFEGRYREVGYDLLYAARLALEDAGFSQIELLPLDDGGSVSSARQRAEALKRNPTVRAVVVAGYDATASDVLMTFGELPVIVVGGWGAVSTTEQVFILSNPDVLDSYTVDPRISLIDAANYEGSITGGEVLALKQFALLRDDLTDVAIHMSALIPDETFAARYLTSDAFADAPGALVQLSYDAVFLLLNVVEEHKSRPAITERLESGVFESVSGTIAFNNGYWNNAPTRVYRFNDDNQLELVDE